MKRFRTEEKNYFQIAAFLNFEQGISRVQGNSNETKQRAAEKCNNTLNFPALDIHHLIGRKEVNSK